MKFYWIWCWWIDRAAIREPSSSSGGQESTNIGESAEEVKRVRRISTLFPFWTTFLVYGLVQATGTLYSLNKVPAWIFALLTITTNSLRMLSSFSGQAYPQMKLFINPINWFVSIQRMLIILIVEVGFRNWIQHDIMEDSHLDKYFLLLAILSGGNLCLHALGRISSHHKCTCISTG